MFTPLLNATEKAARVAVWAGGAMMIFAACMVTVDVFLRKFFATTLGGADEIRAICSPSPRPGPSPTPCRTG